VRAYHGGSDLPRAHLARARIAMAATTDTWVTDERGDALVVWSSPPGAGRTGELKTTAALAVRELLGADARPTIAFERGGYSPACFAELQSLGFHILTYPKAPFRLALRGERRLRPRADLPPLRTQRAPRLGQREALLLLSPGDPARPKDGPPDPGAHHLAPRAHGQRGRQLDVPSLAGGEPVPLHAPSWTRRDGLRRQGGRRLRAPCLNPHKAKAKRALAEARKSLARAEEVEGRLALGGSDAGSGGVCAAYEQAVAAVSEMEATYRLIPAKIRPDARRLDDERKPIHDAIRMATWNAESTLARALGRHDARAEDEAHSLLAEAFKTSGDLEVIGDELHVRLDPLSSPRRSWAIAGLCAELSETETPYPGGGPS